MQYKVDIANTVRIKFTEAKYGCDTLAKEIYNKTFDLITQKINEYTMAKNQLIRNVSINDFSSTLFVEFGPSKPTKSPKSSALYHKKVYHLSFMLHYRGK